MPFHLYLLRWCFLPIFLLINAITSGGLTIIWCTCPIGHIMTDGARAWGRPPSRGQPLPDGFFTTTWVVDGSHCCASCRRDMFIVNQGSTAKDESRYNSLIISIITYSSASWTLTKANKKRLDAFNTKALRRIVGVRWYDYVTNASMLSRTGQPPLTTTIRKLRLGAFEHIFFICRLHPGVTVCACNTVRLPGTGQSAHVIGGSRFTRPASNSRRNLL